MFGGEFFGQNYFGGSPASMTPPPRPFHPAPRDRTRVVPNLDRIRVVPGPSRMFTVD